MVTRSLSLSFWLIAFFLSFTFLPAYQNEMMVGAMVKVISQIPHAMLRIRLQISVISAIE